MGEFDVIERYFRPLCGEGALDLLDDAAILPKRPGHDVVVTKDLLVEGVHFLPHTDAAELAFRALAVNVSDCIAKGATPAHYFVGLSLDENHISGSWLQTFASGLQAGQDKYGCQLMGGDTTRSESGLTISVSMLGYVPSGQMIKRSGANAGDDVYVSGNIGDAALGLICAKNHIKGYDTLLSAFKRADPPHVLGPKLLGVATASADVSDGLLADAGHIAKASGLQLIINKGCVPVSIEANRFLEKHPQQTGELVTGGDDYQLLFTAPKKARETISKLASDLNYKVTKIGECVVGDGVRFMDSSNKPISIDMKGYTHF